MNKFRQALEATATLLTRPQGPTRVLRALAKVPLTLQAVDVVNNVPAETYDHLFSDDLKNYQCRLEERLSRHPWNVRLDEELYISLTAHLLQPRLVFEIGTFDGGTTRMLAEASGPASCVYTLDLPEEEYDQTQLPSNFSGKQVGSKFRQLECAQKITQLFGNSTSYDFSSYEGKMDFVFVDAAHDYEHGLVDSHTALRLVAPKGVIFWHDFDSGWPGLVKGIVEATEGRGLKRILGTTLAVLKC